jgi:diaminohydroxyphosphoribosylaminopyrimidine deaminase/5-amino-6-(5-phosphoribosylamino)uracil reductase
VDVTGPVLSREESRRQNPAFFHNHERGGTYLAIKLAQTLDGKIAAGPGQRTTITGSHARLETHRLRAGFDGILVGYETVRVDDPLLTVREDVPLRKQPARVVLDTEARLSPKARLFQDLDRAPVLVFTSQDAPPEAVGRLEDAGAAVRRIPRGPGGLSLGDMLKGCWDAGLRSLFCEGGGRLASGLIQGEWAQRIHLFVAPFVLGEKGVPAFPGLEMTEVWKGWSPVGVPALLGRDTLLVLDRID